VTEEVNWLWANFGLQDSRIMPRAIPMVLNAFFYFKRQKSKQQNFTLLPLTPERGCAKNQKRDSKESKTVRENRKLFRGL